MDKFEYVVKREGSFPDYWIIRPGQITGYVCRTDNEVSAWMLVAILNTVTDEQMDAARATALQETV